MKAGDNEYIVCVLKDNTYIYFNKLCNKVVLDENFLAFKYDMEILGLIPKSNVLYIYKEEKRNAV